LPGGEGTRGRWRRRWRRRLSSGRPRESKGRGREGRVGQEEVIGRWRPDLRQYGPQHLLVELAQHIHKVLLCGREGPKLRVLHYHRYGDRSFSLHSDGRMREGGYASCSSMPNRKVDYNDGRWRMRCHVCRATGSEPWVAHNLAAVGSPRVRHHVTAYTIHVPVTRCATPSTNAAEHHRPWGVRAPLSHRPSCCCGVHH